MLCLARKNSNYLQSDKISIGPYGDFFYYLNYFFDNFFSDMY